jgi:hypothetical protein
MGEGEKEDEMTGDPELDEILEVIEKDGAPVNGVSEASPVPAPAAPKRGRPRRGARRPAPVASDGDRVREARDQELQERAAKDAEGIADRPPAAVPPKSVFEGARDALVVWPIVLAEAASKNFQPDQISIRVVRVPVGPIELKAVQSQKVELLPLVGSNVCGDETISPSEALYNAILFDYHLGHSGPAIYQLTFQYRFGRGGNIPGVPANVELRLDHPTVIKKQMQEKSERDAWRASGQVPPVQRNPYGFPSPAPSPTVVSSNLDPSENKLLQDLLKKTGYYEGFMKAQAEAAAASTAAPAAPAPAPKDPNAKPPGLSDEEWATIQRQRIAKDMGPAIAQAVTATLVGMGFTPDFVQGLKQVSSGAGAGAPLQSIPQQQQQVTAMGALKEAIALIREVKGFQSQIGELLPGGEEEKEEKEPEEVDETKLAPIGGGLVKYDNGQPAMYARKAKDESSIEYLARMALANQPAFEKLASKIPPDVFGRVMDAVMRVRAGAPPAPQVGQPAGGLPAGAGTSAPEQPKKGWVPD